jgi:hypothetical protein
LYHRTFYSESIKEGSSDKAAGDERSEGGSRRSHSSGVASLLQELEEAVAAEVEADEDFKDSYELWLENEVFSDLAI